MLAFLFLGLLFQPLVCAVTAGESLGIHFDNGNQDAPLLKLDYATYRAVYNETFDVSDRSFNFNKFEADALQTYVFKNVRFAAPPLGELRWAKPAPPPKTEAIQDGKEGRACTQSSRLLLGGASATSPGEDCLFLDVTVPAKAIKTSGTKLPVMGEVLIDVL